MKPIEEIRAAFHIIHRVATGQSDRAYMSIPARPEHDADLIVSAALDELELRRAEREWVDEAFIRGLRWARGAMLKAFGPLGPTPRYFDEAEKEILDLIASTERNVNLKAGENPSRPSVVEESLRAQVEALKAERDHWREEHDTRRGECLAAQMVEKAAQDRAERAQELQRGAEAQHCAALARVEELEGHLAQWQAIARENAEEVRAAKKKGEEAAFHLEMYAKALRELVRVMSHQLARGEDPEEGAFDRAWVAACAALREEPPPKEPRAMWHSAARYVGWLPPDEVERRIAKRFSEVLKLYVEDLRGEELDRKVRELVSKDTARPGAPVGSAPSAEPRSTTHHPRLTPDQFYNLGVTVPRETLERVREALRMVVSRKGGSFGALSECQDPCADALADLDRLLNE